MVKFRKDEAASTLRRDIDSAPRAFWNQVLVEGDPLRSDSHPERHVGTNAADDLDRCISEFTGSGGYKTAVDFRACMESVLYANAAQIASDMAEALLARDFTPLAYRATLDGDDWECEGGAIGSTQATSIRFEKATGSYVEYQTRSHEVRVIPDADIPYGFRLSTGFPYIGPDADREPTGRSLVNDVRLTKAYAKGTAEQRAALEFQCDPECTVSVRFSERMGHQVATVLAVSGAEPTRYMLEVDRNGIRAALKTDPQGDSSHPRPEKFAVQYGKDNGFLGAPSRLPLQDTGIRAEMEARFPAAVKTADAIFARIAEVGDGTPQLPLPQDAPSKSLGKDVFMHDMSL